MFLIRFFTRLRIITLVISMTGAAVFWALDLPLPFLFGPMAACLAAALLGMQMQAMGQVGIAARTILGVAVGASITPALVGQLPLMMTSLAMIPLYILLIGVIGVPFFHRVCKLDRVTSYYGAMPGGLQDMVIFGQEAGGDVRALSLIHATRVLIIVTISPILLQHVYGVGLDHPIGAAIQDLPLFELFLMAAAALIGWKGGVKIGLFGASILGPMLLTSVLSLGDLIHSRPPAVAILVAQFFIGMGIGVYYVGVTVAELRRFVLSGVAFVVILTILAAIFTQLVSMTGLAPPLEVFLAFAPGGQAEMTILAIVVGADLGFVVMHHLTRIIIVIIGAPIVSRLVLKRRKETNHENRDS